MAKRLPVDKVRASRDGHEYHETWAARKAMELLLPGSDLCGIAVEGLHPADQGRARSESVEIADLTLYYGSGPTFHQSTKTVISQYKYSISHANLDFRASDARKTISKFAAAYRDHKKQYGEDAVRDKLQFRLITNRPIYEPLLRAIDGLAADVPLLGEEKKQADQFKAASRLTDAKALGEFAGSCVFAGLSGSLPATKGALSSLLVDWSGTKDILASARLGQLKQMVRDKAGYAGTNRNVIGRPDVLSALDISDPEDLFPCPTALADIGPVVKRKQLATAVELVPKLTKPLLIHAAGGVGKTVFMDSLASALQDRFETVFFDCFGGGAYRSPADSRHLPRNGLIHIANTLAVRGMCDPILPGNDDAERLLKTFRRRLAQCADTLGRLPGHREVALFIDAIDNSIMHARDRNEQAFPLLLLQSFLHEPIAGVKLIVSCRTERKPGTDMVCEELELKPFCLEETRAYLESRLPKVSVVELNVAQARSGGNPRVLEHLVISEGMVLEEPETGRKVELDDLIQKRISDALSDAIRRGYRQEEISTFLAGLGVLPPPIPLDEYASALRMQPSAIESFAADLRPLIERTNQGLMFRDEPTETLVRQRYAASPMSLRNLAASLSERQGVSVYAARALPGLLQMLDDGEQLFNLAFDDRIPDCIRSTVGKRNIRYARLKAATLHAANKEDHNRLVQLQVELSTVAAVDQRGAEYIAEHPDLVVVAQDVDATRRLFETRTGWPGARHARLAIANTLSGDTEEAHRHINMALEWITHYFRIAPEMRVNEPRPDRLDIAAIPFFWIAEGQPERALRFLRNWKDWYKYEFCEHVFDFLRIRQSRQNEPFLGLSNFTTTITDDIGALTALLVFQDPDHRETEILVAKLAKACRRLKVLELRDGYHHDGTPELSDGLRKASAIALSIGMGTQALEVSRLAPHKRPELWSFRDHFHSRSVFSFVFRMALMSSAKQRVLHEKDVLPTELVAICSGLPRRLSGQDFRKKAVENLAKFYRHAQQEATADEKSIKLSYDQKEDAERFIMWRLEPLLDFTVALAGFLSVTTENVDTAFTAILDVWARARKSHDHYADGEFNRFFQALGLEVALFALSVRSDLSLPSVQSFLRTLDDEPAGFGVYTIIQIVSILAKRAHLQMLAGEQGLRAAAAIERENDVTERARLYASLAKAVLPASMDEASTYFRAGIEQMDAIGSGDYDFINELLLFASCLKGHELDERDSHTLTNICELNMGADPEKFPWGAFARGVSKVAGLKGLAKLSRWDDRSLISLRYTLLPYLTALVEDGKIEAEVALALNRLADPVEFHEFGTETLAKAIVNQGSSNTPSMVAELIGQFQDNDPSVSMDTTAQALASIAQAVPGVASEITSYLATTHQRLATVRTTLNEHSNYRSQTYHTKQANDETSDHMEKIKGIAKSTIPTDEASLQAAIEEIKKAQHFRVRKSDFFTTLRAKLRPHEFAHYIRTVGMLENLDLYSKLEELRACKGNWGQSWAFVNDVFANLAVPLMSLHALDLVSYGRLAGYKLREISELTGVPTAYLAVELTKTYAGLDTAISGVVWLALASFVCTGAAEGLGQVALERLLRSDAAKLSNNVIDGPWVEALYPHEGSRRTAAGLVWRMLGSPYAIERWRAAHSVRAFARLGCWDVIDALVNNSAQEDAGPFQAKELGFLFMHARLWLLIALARMALDHPKDVARYREELLRIALEDKQPHVLMQHFASSALRVCMDAGALLVPRDVEDILSNSNRSPFPRLSEKRKRTDYYRGLDRPDTAPKPVSRFHLDIDFDKYNVHSLSEVFGKPAWEIRDMVTDAVHRLDTHVSNMYDSGGRKRRGKNHSYGMTTSFHSYSQHLGWHALFLAAGRLLRNCPVIEDRWGEEDPWEGWLSRFVLTRVDGHWLSDGTDRTPFELTEPLLRKGSDGLELTGDREKLLELAGLSPQLNSEFVVDGRWQSSDGIEVRISSSLVSPSKVDRLVNRLIREEPMLVWLPTYDLAADGSEYLTNSKNEFTPWIVNPSGEARLDEHDPYGTPAANRRPLLAKRFSSILGLKKDDPFGRVWRDKMGRVAILAQAWGREDKESEDGGNSGCRLQIEPSSLQQILTKTEKELLVLIKLKRYESSSYRSESRFTHTVAVVRVTRTLEFRYYEGRINHVHQSSY